MLSIRDRDDVRASVFDRVGAVGERLGEPAAIPPGSRRRSRLSGATVDGVVDRVRLREMTRRKDGGSLSDEVIDQLLGGASTEREIAGPGGVLAQLT